MGTEDVVFSNLCSILYQIRHVGLHVDLLRTVILHSGRSRHNRVDSDILKG